MQLRILYLCRILNVLIHILTFASPSSYISHRYHSIPTSRICIVFLCDLELHTFIYQSITHQRIIYRKRTARIIKCKTQIQGWLLARNPTQPNHTTLLEMCLKMLSIFMSTTKIYHIPTFAKLTFPCMGRIAKLTNGCGVIKVKIIKLTLTHPPKIFPTRILRNLIRWEGISSERPKSCPNRNIVATPDSQALQQNCTI